MKQITGNLGMLSAALTSSGEYQGQTRHGHHAAMEHAVLDSRCLVISLSDAELAYPHFHWPLTLAISRSCLKEARQKQKTFSLA